MSVSEFPSTAWLGLFVTAKLKGVEDCRQGWITSIHPLKITGYLGSYLCEGRPVIVDNPPPCPYCNDTKYQPLEGCPGAFGNCELCSPNVELNRGADRDETKG